jgi:flagellin-specific chaperone FliS
MATISAYGKYQSISLESEAAYEELYIRLARWTSEAIAFQQQGNRTEAESKLDRCIEILGYMDRGIDMSQNRDIALGIMSLHRFAITTLVKAKSEGGMAELESLVRVFFSLADIFAAIRAGRTSS